MTDLSPYEMRVLRHAATGEDQDLICGAALWVATESLERRGLVKLTGPKPNLVYHPTEAGRALVRATTKIIG
jgi:hypothetical protein